ncbi:hypothetical protein ACFE04_018073 [Oxalis oulophora]
MASQPNDLSIPCSLLFCLLLIFLNYPTSPSSSPEPEPDDHQQIPSLSLDDDDDDDGDGDGDGNRRSKKRRVGLRFHPSSDELINHYLKKKVLKIDLHELDQCIREIDILKFDPQDLPAFSTVQSDDWYWYFYYRLEDSGRRTRGGGSGSGGYNRTVKTGNGKWKATGNIRPVKDKKTNKKIGTKKTLVYCPNVVVPKPKPKAKPQAKVHSEWAIHEYQLLPDFPNPDKYVIVMLKKNGDKSVDKAQETINLPEEVNMDLASPSDAPGCQYPLLPTSPVNEINSHSFGMPNAEQVCNHLDPNDQNGHMEEELSFQLMISSPTDEYNQYGMDIFCQQMSTPSFVMDSPPTELGVSIYGYQPIQSTHLHEELEVPHCDTNFNSDPSPFTQAGLDKIFRDIDCETSPQSPNTLSKFRSLHRVGTMLESPQIFLDYGMPFIESFMVRCNAPEKGHLADATPCYYEALTANCLSGRTLTFPWSPLSALYNEFGAKAVLQ